MRPRGRRIAAWIWFTCRDAMRASPLERRLPCRCWRWQAAPRHRRRRIRCRSSCNDLDTRLTRIERVVANKSLLELANDVEALRSDVRAMHNDVDELSHNLETSRKQQRDLYADLDQRLKSLGVAQRICGRRRGGTRGAGGRRRRAGDAKCRSGGIGRAERRSGVRAPAGVPGSRRAPIRPVIKRRSDC